MNVAMFEEERNSVGENLFDLSGILFFLKSFKKKKKITMQCIAQSQMLAVMHTGALKIAHNTFRTGQKDRGKQFLVHV